MFYILRYVLVQTDFYLYIFLGHTILDEKESHQNSKTYPISESKGKFVILASFILLLSSYQLSLNFTCLAYFF